MTTWKDIDVKAVRENLKDEDEKIKVVVEDEDGNSDDAGNDIVVTDDKEDKTVVAKTKEDKSADNKEADEAEKQKEETKSRAKTRITELVKKNKDIEAKYQAEIETLRSQLSLTNREAFTTQKSHIDARIKDVKQALIKSQEEGKFDEAADYMANLSELQTEKLVVDSNVKKIEQESKENPKKSAKTDEFDDTEALAWSVRNSDWYNKDTTMTTLANRLSNRLDKEGFDPSSRDYFEELDERIADFVGTNKVKKVNDNDNDEEDLQSSSKKEAKTKKPPQTSSGVSRTSSSVTRSKDGTVSVRLTEREQAMAKKMGITNQDWAKSKVRAEKARDEHGYNVIFDN